MKGAIIGDVVGSVYEYNNTFNYNFPLLIKESTFTDDTICTVAIADALINNKSYFDTLKVWCRKYPNPKGYYGSMFHDWVFSEDRNFSTNSYGNGALMRLSSIGLSTKLSAGKALMQTQLATECSHNNTIALSYSITYMLILRKLKKYKDKEIVIPLMVDGHGKKWSSDIPSRGTFTSTCQDTLPLAVILFLQSNSFEDAIRKAVSYGGDSDTLAAIVGGMAEAYYGVPEDIWKQVAQKLPKEMLSIIDLFYTSHI